MEKQTFIVNNKGSQGLGYKACQVRTFASVFRAVQLGFTVAGLALILSACQSQRPSSTSTSSSSTSSTSTTGTSGTTTTSTTTTSSTRAIQLITKTGSLGSFDAASAPASGGLALSAARFFNLDGSQIPTAQKPTWLVGAKTFITSSRSQAGVPAMTGSDTPCAYFDSTNDNNPESNGYYVIDGYYSAAGADIDQCAGVAASELNQLSIYIQIDRTFMESDENLQLIVKAKPINAPNTAPNPTECVAGGFFDAANCVNEYFTVSMRNAPGGAAKPFYILFPSAKSLDLLSESVLLPIRISNSITTISIDRVKGGAIIYGVSLIRM